MHKFRQSNEMQAIVILVIAIKNHAFDKVKSLPTGKLMSALLSGLTDRNSVVQKSFAFAMGHLVRVSWALSFILHLHCWSSLNPLNNLSLFLVTDFPGQ